jgi:hypothetical protein
MKIFIAAVCLLVSGLTISAQTRIVAIVEMKIKGLLGGVENGKFVDAKTTAEKLKGNENYTLYGFEGVNEGEFSLKMPKSDQDVCTDFYYVEPSEEITSGIAFGDGYKWNPLKRVPRALDLNSAVYKKAVTDVLRAQGIPKPTVKITQAFRIDLEGDGQEEVLLTATSYKNGIGALDAKVGDYSFVMLRKIVGGKVKNIVVSGEFIKNEIDYGIPSSFEISSIADLNGDGVMEIILYSEYYEGHSSWAVEIKDDKPVEIEILAVGCGV